MEDKVREIAISEVMNPTFAITKQFLATNAVVMENDKPVISDVIFSKDGEFAEVYFPIVDENYFFVVYVDIIPEPALRFMGMNAGNRVYFYAASETETAIDLVDQLDIVPTEIWKKGDAVSARNTVSKNKDSGFEFMSSNKLTGEVEDKLEYILGVLIQNIEKIKALSLKADIGINIAYYGYKEQMWGLDLSANTIKKMAELGVSVDIDLYAGGPDLPASDY